jgi:hypothetical protein
MTSFPENPNLAGEDVNFVRYKDGKPVSWGHMHREEIERFKADGDDIHIVSSYWAPPAPEVDHLAAARFLIAHVLAQSDKYFTSDATDNIDVKTQDKWRKYRRALRDANKEGTIEGLMAALPGDDPKGIDPFEGYR